MACPRPRSSVACPGPRRVLSHRFRCPQFARGSVAEAMRGHVPAAELELAVADDAVNVARLCRAMAEADDFTIRLADIVDRADGCWAWRPRSTARHAARAAMVRRLREDGVLGPAAEDTAAQALLAQRPKTPPTTARWADAGEGTADETTRPPRWLAPTCPLWLITGGRSGWTSPCGYSRTHSTMPPRTHGSPTPPRAVAARVFLSDRPPPIERL